MPTTRHIEATGIQATGLFIRFPMRILVPPFPSIGYAIPGQYGQLDADNGHNDCKKVPTPDMVDVKAIGEKTNSRDTADYPGETRGLEAMVQEALIDQRTDDGNFHCLLSSLKI